jgi:alkaline phosphatase
MKHTTRLMTIMTAALVLLAGCAQAQRPKYVIIMISDGCGYNHIEASSLYQFGKPDGWAYQSFPVRLGMAHFPDKGSYDPALAWSDFEYVKKGPTDSAAAATAMACGIKTYNGAIGVGPNKQPVQNILERAEELRMATGVVSSVPFSHATPAAFLAHNEGRGNYCDIAASMLGSAAEVIMGAGHPLYTDSGQPREAKYQFIGQPQWEQLVAGTCAGDANGDGTPDAWKLIQTKAEFEALGQGEAPARVMGLAQVASTLQDGRAGDGKAPAFAVPFNENVPNLSLMTLAAFNVLDADPDGFCIMIEGGAVDWAAHSNLSGRMIEEEIDFSRAVEAVIQWVDSHSNWNETLLIVTGDHETGYLTGPESGPPATWHPLVNNGAGQMPGMEWHYTSHTNSLLPLFARGAAAERLKTYPQGQDPKRGAYVDNTSVAKVVFEALR